MREQPEGQLAPEEQSNHREPENAISRLTKILQLLRVPCSKTSTCQHKYGCIESILRDSSKLLVITYLLKSAATAIFSLKKLFSAPKKFLLLFLSKNSLQFGFFLGSFVFLFRSIICLLRRLLREESQSYLPLVSGFFSGLIAVTFLEKKTRQTVGLFLLARAIDITYNHLVLKGILPEFKYFYVLVYSLMMGISGYAFGNEPGSMSPEMNKFYLNFTSESLRDMQMRQIWIERKNNYLESLGRGIERQDPLEFMPKLKKYYDSLK